MVGDMPQCLGDSGGLHGISKSKAVAIVDKFGQGATAKLLPKQMPVPHTCAIDTATIVHQVSPQSYGARSK
ncbi:unnamed protein product, partial [Pylaiella littoralis]